MIRATARFIPRANTVLKAVVESKIRPAVERAQDIVIEEARALVPVDTEELRASIGRGPVVESKSMVAGSVKADAEHAAYVEFGTGVRGAATGGDPSIKYDPSWPGMEAQPYLRPAIDAVRRRILSEFGR